MTDGRYRGKFWLNIRTNIGTISVVEKGNVLFLRIAKSLPRRISKRGYMAICEEFGRKNSYIN